MKISKLIFNGFLLLAAILVVIPCLQQGMFLDGVNYANVANNLANGKGTLWHFTYSETFLNHYTHQLPLMIWSEALFFYLFGDSILIERFFCLLLLILNSWAIASLWKVSFPEHRSYFGWPLVLWIITPIVFWGFTNNVQETMMSLCAVVSITYVLLYYKTERIQHLLIGGLFCFLCGFCKGVQGLFPLVAIPFYHFLVQRKSFWSMIKDQLWFTFPLVVLSSAVWIYAPSIQMIQDNFNDRLKSTFVTSVQNTTNDRFDLWEALFMELLVPIGLCLLLLILFSLIFQKVQLNWQKHSLFFLVVGLSASLPLIVTLEQRRFYLITSIPFFVIGIAGIFLPLINQLSLKKEALRISNWITITGIVIALSIASINYNSYKRDELLLTDVHAIGELTRNQIISADPDLMFHYSLIAYLARNYNISLDFSGKEEYDYHISNKNDANVNYLYDGELYHLRVRGK